MTTHSPQEPSRTAAECLAMILESYKLEALPVVMKARLRSLGGELTVEEHMETAEGRKKVYAWALGLAEGVMG